MMDIQNFRANISDAKSCPSGSSQSSSFDVRDSFPYRDILNPELRQSSEAVDGALKAGTIDTMEDRPSSDINIHNSSLKSWESGSTCSSASSNISRKQVNGRTKRINLIRTSGKNFGNQKEWKSPAERVKLLKKKSLAFRRSTQSNYDKKSGNEVLSKTNNGEASEQNERERGSPNTGFIAPDSLGALAPTHNKGATRHRPATPYAKAPIRLEEEKKIDKYLPSTSTTPRKHAAGGTEGYTNNEKDHLVMPSCQDKDPSIPSDKFVPILVSQDSRESSKIGSHSAAHQSINGNFQSYSKESGHNLPLANAASKEFENTANKGLLSPCGLALSIVGGIGAAVEHCIGGHFEKMKRELELSGSMDTLETYETLDTTQRQLLHEVNLMNRMNSWETNGTFNTAATANTAYTMATTDTADNTFLSNMPPENSQTDDENLNAAQTQKPKQNRILTQPMKRKKKIKKRTKVVNFEYPPISSMKACPRVTEEERKKLFFTESELDDYERDRTNNICDDVEIVAVEFSDDDSCAEDCESETSAQSHNTDQAIDQDRSESSNPKTKPSLRTGKFAKRPPEGQSLPSHSDRLAGAQKNVQNNSSDQRASTPDSNAISGASSASSGKIKGVQIYLRQRSVK